MAKASSVIKWLKRIGLSLVVLLILGGGYFYVASSMYYGETFEAQSRSFMVADTSDPGEGERLARLRGCQDGCHGIDGMGGEFLGMPTPSLTAYMQTRSDVEIEIAVRQGIRKDNTSVPITMPSAMFARMSDEDLGHIIAFFRSLPKQGEVPENPSINLELRAGMFAVDFDLRSATYTEGITPVASVDKSDTRNFGKYLALTVCSECHGQKLHGFFEYPDLAVVGAYTLAEFETLMKTGIATGGRELDLMTSVAKSRFSHFNDDEVAALYSYLSSEAFLDEDRE